MYTYNTIKTWYFINFIFIGIYLILDSLEINL